MADEQAAMTLDWGIGHYETTAEQLLPAAQVLVDSAALEAGERVLDVGCGTGMLAARTGARVTGVDPASRLLDVARSRGVSKGADIVFLPGHAAALPVGEASVDVILSVFGVIFAPDAPAAAAEMSRVLTSNGRIVLSAWLPQGTVFEFTSAVGEAVRQALGGPRPPASFSWHDREALLGLLGPHGFSVETEEHSLSFTASSPAAYLDRESRNHPMAIVSLRVLDGAGQADALRSRVLQILEAGNEDRTAFQVTSSYIVATCRPETGRGLATPSEVGLE